MKKILYNRINNRRMPERRDSKAKISFEGSGMCVPLTLEEYGMIEFISEYSRAIFRNRYVLELY